MNLALVDYNAINLARATAILEPLAKANEKTVSYTLDVSQFGEWQKIKSDVERNFGTVELLMLNAGASFKPKDGGEPWGDIEYYQKVEFFSQPPRASLETDWQTNPYSRLLPPT